MLRQLEVKITSFSKEGILTNGPMTLADFIQHHARDPAKARQAAKYDRANWRKTNPLNADTDDDGIPDGEDLNPNGLAPALFDILLRNLTVIDPIDVTWPESKCSPELYAIIDIKTAAGNVAVDTPTVVDLPSALGYRAELDLASVLSPATMAKSAFDGPP